MAVPACCYGISRSPGSRCSKIRLLLYRSLIATQFHIPLFHSFIQFFFPYGLNTVARRSLLFVIFLGLLVTLSQANILGDAHLLKRYPQVYGVSPVSTHSANDVLPGHGNATRTSIRILLPASTLRMIDGTSLSSTSLFESTSLETETKTNAYIDHGTSEVLSQTTESISDPVSDDQGISATSIELDWTGLLPVTPSTGEPFFKTTRLSTGQVPATTDPITGVTPEPNTSYNTGSSRATEPTTTDISLLIT